MNGDKMSISEFKSKIQLLSETERKSLAWLEHSPVCTKIVDLDFNLLYMSSAGIKALCIDDITPYYCKSYPLEIYLQPFRDQWQSCFNKVKETGVTTKQDVIALSTEGKELWFDTTFLPVHNDDEQVISIMVISVDITDRKKNEAEISKLNSQLEEANKQLKIKSETDSLTEVPNRRFYERRLSENIAMAKRNETYLSYLMIDIDDFKRYNDAYGHDAGDTALCNIAQSIENSLQRETDLVARFGGEEFVVLLPETDAESALAIAEKIQADIKALGLEYNHSDTDTVSVSIGIEVLKGNKLNKNDLFKHSDIALYAAKDRGKNCSCIYIDQS